jgi:hypothetical protein
VPNCLAQHGGKCFSARPVVMFRKGLHMKKRDSIKARRLLMALAAVAALGGCAVVPYDSGYYEPGYAEPTVYVAPAVSFGFYGSSGHGYYGHRHGYWRGRGYGGYGGYRGGHYGRH